MGIPSQPELAGRVAVVTGASGGLGRAIASELDRLGALIANFDLDCEGAGRTPCYRVDVSDSAQVDKAFENVFRDLGRIDILVSNAGIARVGSHTQDTTDEDWLQAINVMQSGVFYCMRAASRYMLPAGVGSVVNIASIRGLSPKAGRIAYSAAKAAVIMMTKVAAAERGAQGVRVNAVAPGFVRTAMWDSAVAEGLIDEREMLGFVPVGRIADPEDVARLVAFLCCDGAAYITGSVNVIDGGVTIADRA